MNSTFKTRLNNLKKIIALAVACLMLLFSLYSIGFVYGLEKDGDEPVDRHHYDLDGNKYELNASKNGEAEDQIGFPAKRITMSGMHRTLNKEKEVEVWFHAIDCVHYNDIKISIADIRNIQAGESEYADLQEAISETSFFGDTHFNGSNEFNKFQEKKTQKPYVANEDFSINIPDDFGTETGEYILRVDVLESQVLYNGVWLTKPYYNFDMRVTVTDDEGILAAEKEAAEKAEQEAREKAEREKAEQEAREKAEREKAEQEAREQAEREKAEQDDKDQAEKDNKDTKDTNEYKEGDEIIIDYNKTTLEPTGPSPEADPTAGSTSASKSTKAKSRKRTASSSSGRRTPLEATNSVAVADSPNTDAGSTNNDQTSETNSENEQPANDEPVTVSDADNSGLNPAIDYGSPITDMEGRSTGEKIAMVGIAGTGAATAMIVYSIISDMQVLLWYTAKRR